MTMEDRLPDINAYLSDGIHRVSGWCVPQLWQSIWPVAQLIGDGPVAEIGVFEGKFLIGLTKTFGTDAQNMGTAIDVFDMQQFNIDGAGVGKLDVLKTNLDSHGVGSENMHYVKADSLALTARDTDTFLDRTGQAVFFSVDGCHEVVHTVNDIEFAMSVTANRGLIAVDDYTNPNWPGVQEAVAKMYLMRDFVFVPLVVTCNKMLLCSYSYHAAYLQAIHSYIEENHPTTRMKRVKRFGYDSLTVMPKHPEWSDLKQVSGS
jgi:hypothetical protein